MEEEEKRKGPISLDWELLLPSTQDDEPLPDLEVSTTAAEERKQSPPLMGDDQQEQREDEFGGMSDTALEEAISRQKKLLSGTLKLPDGGEKPRARIKRLEEEREWRRRRPVIVNDYGGEKLTQSKRRCCTSASGDIMQEAPSSEFCTHFNKKLEENQTDSRTVNAFESELSCLARGGSWKSRRNGQFSPRGRHKSVLSSRQSPFQCPTSLSVGGLSTGNRNGRCSTHHCEEISSDAFMKKKKAYQSLLSNDLGPRNGQPVVLVDEEEPEPTQSMEQAEKVDECMKDCKIYYPSRDDPESVEICYSDMECLAPEAYLSSTIMNFYIRHLQQPVSALDSGRSDYHFFNTYFYNKLKEAVSKKTDKESSFVKLRRWWKSVNIFRKAYILLPVHENLHWSLVIICIPDKEDESGPIILHLDSLGLHISESIFGNVKSFLTEEWEYLNRGQAPLDLPISERVWKNLSRRIVDKRIEVPQQRNEYDCGLFVLFFMERFIDEAPQRLKRKDLAMFGKRWFKPEEASNLRRKIKKLLVEEFRKATKDDCISTHGPSSTVAPQGQKFEQPIDCS